MVFGRSSPHLAICLPSQIAPSCVERHHVYRSLDAAWGATPGRSVWVQDGIDFQTWGVHHWGYLSRAGCFIFNGKSQLKMQDREDSAPILWQVFMGQAALASQLQQLTSFEGPRRLDWTHILGFNSLPRIFSMDSIGHNKIAGSCT